MGHYDNCREGNCGVCGQALEYCRGHASLRRETPEKKSQMEDVEIIFTYRFETLGQKFCLKGMFTNGTWKLYTVDEQVAVARGENPPMRAVPIEQLPADVRNLLSSAFHNAKARLTPSTPR